MDEARAREAVSAAPSGSPAKRAKQCRCGHDKEHPMVSATGEYTFMGWVLIMIGISASPIAIRYVCRRCEQVVGRTTDPAIISQTQLWG